MYFILILLWLSPHLIIYVIQINKININKIRIIFAMSNLYGSGAYRSSSPIRQISNNNQNAHIIQGDRVLSSQVIGYNSGNQPTVSNYSAYQTNPIAANSQYSVPTSHVSYPIQHNTLQNQQMTYVNAPTQQRVVYHQPSITPQRDTIVRDPIVEKRVVHVQDEVDNHYHHQQYHRSDPRQSRRYYQRHQQGYHPKPKSSICNPCCLSLLGLLLLAGLLVGGFFIVKAIQDAAGQPENEVQEDIQYKGTHRVIEQDDKQNGSIENQQQDGQTALSPAVIDIDQNPEPAQHTIKQDVEIQPSSAVIDSDQQIKPTPINQQDEVNQNKMNSSDNLDGNTQTTIISQDEEKESTTTKETNKQQYYSIDPVVINPVASHMLRHQQNVDPIAVQPKPITQQKYDQLKQKEEEYEKGDPLIIRVRPTVLRQSQVNSEENQQQSQQNNAQNSSQAQPSIQDVNQSQDKLETIISQSPQNQQENQQPQSNKQQGTNTQNHPQILFQYPPSQQDSRVQ